MNPIDTITLEVADIHAAAAVYLAAFGRADQRLAEPVGLSGPF